MNALPVDRDHAYYLNTEMDEVVAEWSCLEKVGTKDEMVLYLGRRTLRVLRVEEVPSR